MYVLYQTVILHGLLCVNSITFTFLWHGELDGTDGKLLTLLSFVVSLTVLGLSIDKECVNAGD